MNPNQHNDGRNLLNAADWSRTPGEYVEIRAGDTVLLRGIVDTVMPNGTGFWLAADGVQSRSYIDKDDGLELWVEHGF